MEKISILGVVTGQEEVQIENDKVKAIKEWKTSTKIKKVESFLVFANFYQQFIKKFSHTTRLLNELKEKRIGNRKKNIKQHLKS